MRLKISKNSAEEILLNLLNEGYNLGNKIFHEYINRVENKQFDPHTDIDKYHTLFNDWIVYVAGELEKIFPTQMESNFFCHRFSPYSASYGKIDNRIGLLVYERFPRYLSRIHEILNTHLNRYSDLPLKTRLFVEDIDSFFRVRDVNPAMVTDLLKLGRIELAEDEVQIGIESILNVPFHKKDWGGETNDLYTANIVINDARRSTAFLLKGNGLKSKELTIADCGKNGDQIMRLFQCPAELYVVEYIGPISEAVIQDCEEKTALRRANGKNANFLIIDGQDTARLLYAYGKLELL